MKRKICIKTPIADLKVKSTSEMECHVLIALPIYDIYVNGVFIGQFIYDRRFHKFCYSFFASSFNTDVNNVRLKLHGAVLTVDDNLPF